jgi:hypothetical protein
MPVAQPHNEALAATWRAGQLHTSHRLRPSAAKCRGQRQPRSSWRQLSAAPPTNLVLALGCQVAVVHLLQFLAALLLGAHDLALALLLRVLGIQLLLLVVCRRGQAGGDRQCGGGVAAEEEGSGRAGGALG